MVVSINGDTQKLMVYKETRIKIDDLGVLPFSETSTWWLCQEHWNKCDGYSRTKCRKIHGLMEKYHVLLLHPCFNKFSHPWRSPQDETMIINHVIWGPYFLHIKGSRSKPNNLQAAGKANGHAVFTGGNRENLMASPRFTPRPANENHV